MKTIQQIIDLFGGMAWLKKPGNWIRLEQPHYLRLVIEWVPPGTRGALPHHGAVSVAHYGEQNGDAMRDPEICFAILEREGHTRWLPLYYRNDYVGLEQEPVQERRDGALDVDVRTCRDLHDFAEQWDRNLRQQGWLGVAKAKLAAVAARN